MSIRHPYALAAAAAPILVGTTMLIPKTDSAEKTISKWAHRLELGATVGALALSTAGFLPWKNFAKVAAISGLAFVAGTLAHRAHDFFRDHKKLRVGWETPSPTPPLTKVDPSKPTQKGDFKLGENWLMGTTTSATQVEGAGIDNDIARWAKTHKGWAPPSPGLDHWNRLDEDYTHLQGNGHNAHGFTIDWSRIEPSEGHFDRAAIEHYRKEIEICKEKGMEPMVTLLQYALPAWLSEKGGVLSPEAPKLFARFAKLCAEEFGEDVTWWKTMNEPNTLAAAEYMAGVWPPGEKAPRKMLQALEGQLRMHAAAATELHKVAKEHHRDAKVGIAYIDDKMYPYQWWNPIDQVGAKAYDYVGNDWFLNSLEAGKAIWPIGSGETIKGLKGSIDFIGLNYYGRGWGHFAPGDEGGPFVDKPNPYVKGKVPLADEEGMYEMTLKVWNQFHKPVLIAENGVDLPEPDKKNARGRAVVDTLAALKHAQDDGAEVLGYLHWTDWDSPEWHDGYSQHYGLFGFDPKTGRRWDKPAAATFETLSRRHSIPKQWLSSDNKESPSRRDRFAAREKRILDERR